MKRRKIKTMKKEARKGEKTKKKTKRREENIKEDKEDELQIFVQQKKKLKKLQSSLDPCS